MDWFGAPITWLRPQQRAAPLATTHVWSAPTATDVTSAREVTGFRRRWLLGHIPVPQLAVLIGAPAPRYTFDDRAAVARAGIDRCCTVWHCDGRKHHNIGGTITNTHLTCPGAVHNLRRADQVAITDTTGDIASNPVHRDGLGRWLHTALLAGTKPAVVGVAPAKQCAVADGAGVRTSRSQVGRASLLRLRAHAHAVHQIARLRGGALVGRTTALPLWRRGHETGSGNNGNYCPFADDPHRHPQIRTQLPRFETEITLPTHVGNRSTAKCGSPNPPRPQTR